MKAFKVVFLLLIISMLVLKTTAEEKEYPAYYRVASLEGNIAEVSSNVKSALESQNFEIVGEYNPGNSDTLYVICFTRKDLADITLKFNDRGALASVLKVGLVKTDGKIDISIINPEYIFYAYLYEGIDPYISRLEKVANDVKNALSILGDDFEPFGGFEDRDDLEDYRYKIMMPYFTDPVELEEYNSFEEGLTHIRTKLGQRVGNAVKIYEVVYTDQKVAVFGIGLLDAEEGEAEFLPIIGAGHVAAMPYEIILQGNEATMLNGRYRIALHWPELGMGTFMKIMSTPGNIEDFMLGITEINED